MSKKHGAVVSEEDKQTVKDRAKALSMAGELINSTSAEDLDDWLMIMKQGVIGGTFSDGLVTDVVRHLLHAVSEIGMQLNGPEAYIAYMAAVEDSLETMAHEHQDFRKEIAKLQREAIESMIEDPSDDVEKDRARSLLRFLDKMEKQDEDSNSDIPNTGGS